MILLLAERGCSRLAARVPQLLRKLSSGLLLRDLEQSVSARGETEPLGERRRAAVASARLDAAMLLASKGSVAEAAILLRAADAALEGEAEESTPLSAELSAEARTAFDEHLDSLTQKLAERTRAALSPAAIRKLRRRRIGGLAFFASLVVLGALLLRRGSHVLTPEASASWGDAFTPKAAVDGLVRTEWLLPDATAGWVEVRLARPRSVSRIRLLNARNLPHADRSTDEFHMEAFLGEKVVKSIDGRFPGYRPKPTWIAYDVDETVDRVRIEVRSWHLSGGGFAEIEVE